MQVLIQFVVNIVKSIFEMCQQNMFLQWSLYTFVAYMLIKAYSVIWGGRGSDIRGSFRSGVHASGRRSKKESSD